MTSGTGGARRQGRLRLARSPGPAAGVAATAFCMAGAGVAGPPIPTGRSA